jgi:parallel beta-helix repeat protein
VSIAPSVLAGDLDPTGAPTPTPGPEPRTPVTALPVSLEGPGSFYLVSDLTGSAGVSGISISGEGATLDLNGFSLIGVPGSLIGIRMTGSGHRVHNGTVRDWGGNGITMSSGANLRDLVVQSNGSYGATGGSGVVVRDCVFQDNTGNGLRVHWASTVERCTASYNGYNGFVIEQASVGRGLSASHNSKSGIAGGLRSNIIDSNASDNEEYGIRINQGALVGCSVSDNRIGGIIGYGSTISACSAYRNRYNSGAPHPSGAGFQLEEGCHLESCVAVENHAFGIVVQAESTVLNCTVVECGFGTAVVGPRGGIVVTGTGTNNRIDGNTVANCNGGILVAGLDNIVLRNTVTDSGTAYTFAADNAYGPIIDVARIGDITAAVGDSHPWANFEF